MYKSNSSEQSITQISTRENLTRLNSADMCCGAKMEADCTVSVPTRNQKATLSSKSLAPENQLICMVEGKQQKGQHDTLQNRATVVTSSTSASQPQQVSSNTDSRPSVLHVTPLPHPTPVTPKPPRVVPVKAEPPQLQVLPQGINLTNLEWIQKQASKSAPRQSVLSRSTAASAPSVCFSSSLAPAESYRVPAEAWGKSPVAGSETISSTKDNKRERHLHNDHQPVDKGTAQCLIQKEVVENLEQQLALEKMKLHVMQTQLAGRLNTHRLFFMKSTEQSERSVFFHPSSTTVSTLPVVHASLTNQDGILESFCSVRRHLWGCHHGSSLLPDMDHSVEYYKVNNVRPPFTYASLISWAILESPEKQLTLSEIYHWFTRRFAYFRHNTATWKNAVRHNLSLHKCFVRVENVKGAVWTVDEVEYQRKKGAKLSRDQEMKRFLSSQLHLTDI